jgi:hypothetical protein
MGEEAEAIMAVYDDGLVQSICVVDPDAKYYRDALATWPRRPGFRELVRVPIEIARISLFQPWHGIEAARAALAKADAGTVRLGEIG